MATQPENVNIYGELRRRDSGYLEAKVGNTYHNRYFVLQKLGWGSFSTVWLCWDKLKSQFVALKIVRSSDQCTDAALREIEFLDCVQRCQSDDPQPRKIVQLLDRFTIPAAGVYSFLIDRRHICLVFETLGPNLREMMEDSGKKSLPLPIVKSILRQILEALDYLHTTCKIIHKAIKPENICVDETEDFKLESAMCEKAGVKFSSPRKKLDADDNLAVTLIDLGCACWVDTDNKDAIHARLYRSPEITLGNEYRANTDVWSTACVAFELATGEYLFPPVPRNTSSRFSEDQYHLPLVARLLGDIPKRIAFASEQSRGFFSKNGELLRALPFKSCDLLEKLTGQVGWDASEAGQFADFLLPMLAIDPNERCSAKDCLGHKWLEL